jgi:hypothetical protein
MAEETSKANVLRRSKEQCFVDKFFNGNGIDVGAGSNPLNYSRIRYKDSNNFGSYRFISKNSFFPKIKSVKIYSWDWNPLDEAEKIVTREGVRKYDFCYSSNLLEHVISFQRSLLDFSLITKIGGYIINSVPDFFMYEKEIWPPIKNADHKSCFSICKNRDIEAHYNLSKVLTFHSNLHICKLELADTLYDYTVEDKSVDQTYTSPHGAECFIEFVCKVLPGNSGYNNYTIISQLDFLSLDDRDITQDVLVVQDTISETEKLRIANLPYTDTFIPLADDIQNSFPVFINKNYIAKFKNSLK